MCIDFGIGIETIMDMGMGIKTEVVTGTGTSNAMDKQ